MSRRFPYLAVTAAFMCASPSSAKKPDYVYGPPPDWEIFKAIGSRAVLAQLPDPARWTVEWPNAYVKAGWGPRGRTPGYMTCGVLRATGMVTDNRYFINFAIVIDNGAVKLVDLAKASNSAPNLICAALVKKAMLPPASTMPVRSEQAISTVGITVRAMADGAYVTVVTDGSAAQQVGLTPGMVIIKVNGIALAGMGEAMAKLLGSDAASLRYELAGGERLVIRGAR